MDIWNGFGDDGGAPNEGLDIFERIEPGYHHHRRPLVPFYVIASKAQDIDTVVDRFDLTFWHTPFGLPALVVVAYGRNDVGEVVVELGDGSDEPEQELLGAQRQMLSRGEKILLSYVDTVFGEQEFASIPLLGDDTGQSTKSGCRGVVDLGFWEFWQKSDEKAKEIAQPFYHIENFWGIFHSTIVL